VGPNGRWVARQLVDRKIYQSSPGPMYRRCAAALWQRFLLVVASARCSIGTNGLTWRFGPELIRTNHPSSHYKD